MRKWHRWLSVPFAVFIIWIAATGLLSQLVPIYQRGGLQQRDGPPPVPASAMPPGFVCPETLTCRPKPKGPSLVGTLHHLHSGESFGPAGTIVSILSGFALLFFAVSGMVMYVRMFRARSRRERPGENKFFWK
jgi:uncharacterized iron-regulated membrane protein